MKYKINGTLLTFVTALWRCLQPLSKRSTTNGHRRYNGGYFWSERSQKVPEISNKTRMVGSLHKSPGDVSGLRSRPFAFFLAFCCTGVRQHAGNLCFVHPICFWYFGHFSWVIFFPFFFRLAHLALQNVNKDYIIFSYFRNFVTKSDQKPKTKNGMNETIIYKAFIVWKLTFLLKASTFVGFRSCFCISTSP